MLTISENEKALQQERSLQSWVHLYGGAVSEAVLDPSFKTFTLQDVEGFIGYFEGSGCFVTFGDPICKKEDAPKLAQAFHRYAEEQNANIIFMIASESFAQWAFANISPVLLEVGEELIFDPQKDPKEGSKGYRLRNRLNHCQKFGIEVHEYLEFNPQLEKSIQETARLWLKGRQGPQIHLGDLEFFKNRQGKRWFYLTRGGKVVGIAELNQLIAEQGWLLKFLIILPKCPRGTSELLMMTILEKLKEENCHFLTYGIVPSTRLGEIKGLSKLKEKVIRITFKMIRWLFRLEQRKTYWQKFRPATRKSFALFTQSRVGLKELRAITKALKID